jgi:hypothetical protein
MKAVDIKSDFFKKVQKIFYVLLIVLMAIRIAERAMDKRANTDSSVSTTKIK